MKIPGPDHPITIAPAAKRWRAKFAGHVIADSADALVLQESTYPAVIYFPRADVSTEFTTRSERSTHCPYKGDATYYSLLMDGNFAENAIWSYQEPFPAMAGITGRLAFYTDKVEIYEVEDAAVNPHHLDTAERSHIDEVVQHTDSGSGAAQREHWPPNVDGPHEGGVR